MKKVIVCLMLTCVLFSCSNISNELETIKSSSSSYFSEQDSLRTKFRNQLELEMNKTDSRSFIEDSNSNVTLIITDEKSSADFLLKNNFISISVAEYINKVESILYDDMLNIDETFEKILNVENEAKIKLSINDYQSLCNYTEMSMAALDYFTNEYFSTRSFISWLKSNSKKILCAVVSGAVGAVVGGVIGTTTGTVTIPIIGV